MVININRIRPEMLADVADELLAEYEFRWLGDRPSKPYVDSHPDWLGHQEQAQIESCFGFGPLRPDEYRVSGGTGCGRGLKIWDEDYVSFRKLLEKYRPHITEGEYQHYLKYCVL